MDYKEVTLGIDIGGTNTKLGLVDIGGDCMEFSSISTRSETESIYEFLKHLYREVGFMQKRNKKVFIIKAVGVGAPNANYYTGRIEQAPNLGWGKIVELKKLIQEKFSVACTTD